MAADADGRFPPGWDTDAIEIRSKGQPITVGAGHLCGFFDFGNDNAGDDLEKNQEPTKDCQRNQPVLGAVSQK